MKLSAYDIKCLETIHFHTKQDLHYGEGGSYCTDTGKLDKPEIKRATHALEVIEQLVKENIKA